MVDDTHSDRGRRLYEAVSAEPAVRPPELRMDSVLRWFGLQLSPARRVELMYGLLHMCQPLELRFLGACLETLAQRDFPFLREFDVNTNTYSQRPLGDVSDPVVWSQLLVSLALLASDNRDGAGELQRVLSQIDPVSLLQSTGLNYLGRSRPGGHDALSGGGSAEDTLELLFTMASLHPAFSFNHREVAKLKRAMLEQMMEKRRDIHHLQRMSGGDLVMLEDRSPPSTLTHQTITVPPHISHPTSPQDTENAVAIDHLVMIRVTWNRPNWEYTIEVHWSDSTQTTMTKTHHQLESFVSELPCGHHSQVFQKELLSVLQQADQYEPWELKNKLCELLQRAPKAFRESEQICSYFLPHSQSETFMQAPEQPPLKPLSQRCKADTLLTPDERWDDGLPYVGRGRRLNMDVFVSSGLEKQRHPFGFSGTTSDLLQKMEGSQKTEDYAKEKSSCILATSNPTVHVLGSTVLQTTPTPTPQPVLGSTVQLAQTPELNHEHTLSSLLSSPSSSPCSTHSFSPWSELDRSLKPQPNCSPSEGYPCHGEGPDEQSNDFLSQQNWNSKESAYQKNTQAQPLLHSQEVKKVFLTKNMTQNRQQLHDQSLVKAQTPSLPHFESQEAMPQLHVIQARSHVQDHIHNASKDHNATESEVQQDQSEPSPTDMEPLVHQSLIQAFPCTVHTQTHGYPNDQVSQVPHNLTEPLPITADYLAKQTQNVSAEKHQVRQNLIQSSICTDTPAQTQIDSVGTELLPSLDLHASGSFPTSTSVIPLTTFSLFSTSNVGQAPIFAHVTKSGKTPIVAQSPSSSQTAIEAPKTSLSQATIPAPNIALNQATDLALSSSLNQATVLAPPSSLSQATALMPISTEIDATAPTMTSLSSSYEAHTAGFVPVPVIVRSPNSPDLAQAADHQYAQSKTTYPAVLAPSPDRFKLQHTAPFSPFISVICPSLSQPSSLGLEPSSSTSIKQAGSGSLSCYNCGKNGHSGEYCLELSKGLGKQVAE